MILVLVAFALAGVPVWRLTRPDAAAAAVVVPVGGLPVAVAEAGAKPDALDVEAVFAPPPTDFQIKNLDQTVLAGHGPEARFTTRWTTVVPPEGVDLVVRAHWATAADGGMSAARVTVRFPDGRQVEQSFWSGENGALEEVFTVPGTAASATP